MVERMEVCPICMEHDAEYETECKHGYCVYCICRIDACAICRNYLARENKKKQCCKELLERKKTKHLMKYFTPIPITIQKVFESSSHRRGIKSKRSILGTRN